MEKKVMTRKSIVARRIPLLFRFTFDCNVTDYSWMHSIYHPSNARNRTQQWNLFRGLFWGRVRDILARIYYVAKIDINRNGFDLNVIAIGRCAKRNRLSELSKWSE